jgi:hypothetical protein
VGFGFDTAAFSLLCFGSSQKGRRLPARPRREWDSYKPERIVIIMYELEEKKANVNSEASVRYDLFWCGVNRNNFLFHILLFTSLHVSASKGHPKMKYTQSILEAITPATVPFLGYTVNIYIYIYIYNKKVKVKLSL